MSVFTTVHTPKRLGVTPDNAYNTSLEDQRGMKYNTIVMDPPWRITATGPNSKPCHGKIKRWLDYDTMSDREIESFPIDDFASEQCNLFMWTIHSRLPFTMDLLQKWGFKYYCTFTWIKNSGITMQGVFRNSEFAVFGYRGQFDIPFTGKAITTAFNGKTGAHSEKPSEFYTMIKTKTKPPRIDLFARKRHLDFDVWGDQAEAQAQARLDPMII